MQQYKKVCTFSWSNAKKLLSHPRQRTFIHITRLLSSTNWKHLHSLMGDWKSTELYSWTGFLPLPQSWLQGKRLLKGKPKAKLGRRKMSSKPEASLSQALILCSGCSPQTLLHVLHLFYQHLPLGILLMTSYSKGTMTFQGGKRMINEHLLFIWLYASFICYFINYSEGNQWRWENAGTGFQTSDLLSLNPAAFLKK